MEKYTDAWYSAFMQPLQEAEPLYIIQRCGDIISLR